MKINRKLWNAIQREKLSAPSPIFGLDSYAPPPSKKVHKESLVAKILITFAALALLGGIAVLIFLSTGDLFY